MSWEKIFNKSIFNYFERLLYMEKKFNPKIEYFCYPNVEVEALNGRYMVSMKLPNLSKEELFIDFNNHELIISGRVEPRNAKNHLWEGMTGCFSKYVYLDKGIGASSLEVQYDKNTLYLSFPTLKA